MRILVTGVAGFLGSHVANTLSKQGHEVVGVDNLVGGYKSNIGSGINFFQEDLLNYHNLAQYFDDIDIVIHSACTAYEGLSVFSPSYVVNNTYQITVNAISWAIKSGVKKFIYLSSMARYGTQSTYPFVESMTPKPQDPYGIAKYASELTLVNLSETHGMEYVILVPHNIIGPGQKYDDPFRNVASIMINRMLQGKQPIIYGNGEQLRCFSFIDDVVQPLVNSCFNNDAIGEIINIGPDEELVTINELANIIGRILNFKVEPIYVPERPQEVKVATCSANKARDILRYRTTVNLENGLTKLASWIAENGPKEFYYHVPVEIDSELTPKTWTQKQI